MKGKDFETTYPAPYFFAGERTWTLKIKTLVLDYPFIYRRGARIQVTQEFLGPPSDKVKGKVCLSSNTETEARVVHQVVGTEGEGS